MKNFLNKTATLALIGAALAFQGANAQIIPQAANGDLIFGAENISSTGSASGKDDEVDLGSITLFTAAAASGATLTFNGVNTFNGTTLANVSLTDINAALGSITTSSYYSVVGSTGGSIVGGYDEKSMFITATAATAGNLSASSFNGLSLSSGDAVSVYNGLNQVTGFTAGSNAQTGIITIGTGNSYSEEEGSSGGGTTPFNFGITNNTTLLNGGQLDLYALDTDYPTSTNKNTIGTLTELGYFQYGSNDVLTFTGIQAAPEPSTYVLMLAGLGALFYFQRRRSLKS